MNGINNGSTTDRSSPTHWDSPESNASTQSSSPDNASATVRTNGDAPGSTHAADTSTAQMARSRDSRAMHMLRPQAGPSAAPPEQNLQPLPWHLHANPYAQPVSGPLSRAGNEQEMAQWDRLRGLQDARRPTGAASAALPPLAAVSTPNVSGNQVRARRSRQHATVMMMSPDLPHVPGAAPDGDPFARTAVAGTPNVPATSQLSALLAHTGPAQDERQQAPTTENRPRRSRQRPREEEGPGQGPSNGPGPAPR